jgi:hypothetical protein
VQERAKKRGGRNPFKDFFGEDSPFGDSPFDDSFFDNFFGQTTEKSLTLHTDGAVVKIKPLPNQGRPAGFSGAVGKFDIASEASSTTGSTGDPLTFKISITGHGNFDRVTSSGLPANSDWKSYKPRARLESANSSGTSGTKTFEQSIVPVKAGAQQIPAVSFSYFDPDTESYVTKTTVPISVQITQNTAAPAAVVSAAADTPMTSPDGLAADEVIPAHAASSLRPLVHTPWFIVVNTMMLAALVIGALWRTVSNRHARNPQRLEREAAEKELRESLAAMDAALRAKDAPRFFDAARSALQTRLATLWQVPADRVTISEIRTRLNGRGEEMRAVFRTADEIAYSGRRFTAPDLEQWRSLIESQLQQLARP